MKRAEGKGINKRMEIQQGRNQMEKGNCYFFIINCVQALYVSLVNNIEAIWYSKRYSWATFCDENHVLGMVFKVYLPTLSVSDHGQH